MVATIPVGSGPRVVTFSPDGTRAYVANFDSNNVSVIDTATNSVVTTIPVGTQPTGVVVTPDGTLAYVTNTADNTVSVINIATNSVVATLPVGLSPLVAGICSNGNALLGAGLTFKANTSGALSCTQASGPAGSPGPVFTGGTLQIAGANISSGLPITLQSQGGIVDTNGNNATLSGAISGPGGLSKIGAGTLTLSGQSTYTGSTGVNVGTLQAGAVNAFSPSSAFTVASGATLNLASFNQTIGSLAGTGAVTLGSATLTTGNDNTSTIFSGTISGTGGLTKIGSGMLLLTGANTYTGPTNINAGILDVNGSLVSTVFVNAGGTLMGNGMIGGLNVSGGGIVAPGNSIGTLNVAGNLSFAPGSIYQVEANAAGQSDKIIVGGTATLSGGSVQVLAQNGTYARQTRYTILSASSGLSGTFSGVTSNFAFLTPSLTYDANNVFLTLFQSRLRRRRTNAEPVRRRHGARSGQRHRDRRFQYRAGCAQRPQQHAGPGGAERHQRPALGRFRHDERAERCTVHERRRPADGGRARRGERRPAPGAGPGLRDRGLRRGEPVGRLGERAGWAGQCRRQQQFQRADLQFRRRRRRCRLPASTRASWLASSTGYAAGNQWVDSFMGRGWTDSVSVLAYGSFTQAGFYTDALAGYAYSSNQLQRQIIIPGLQPRTANGSTGANQFLGQVEAGYQVPLFAPAAATVTPFARLQGSTVTQNSFTEWGAQSLSLNVAQQTTNSLRTTFGADLAGAIGLSVDRKLDLALRLGWLHEYADTGRPITGAFAGAPSNAFTVYGATPQRDSALIGFLASTAITGGEPGLSSLSG